MENLLFKIVLTVAGSLAGSWLLGWLLRGPAPRARIAGDRKVLGYAGSMKLFSIANLTFWVVLLILLANFGKPADKPVAAVIFAVFCGVGLYLFWEAFWLRVEFDDDGVQLFSPWRKNRRVPWTRVMEIHYSPTMHWYVCHTHGHGRFRLSGFLSGLPDFLDKCREKGARIITTAPLNPGA